MASPTRSPLTDPTVRDYRSGFLKHDSPYQSTPSIRAARQLSFSSSTADLLPAAIFVNQGERGTGHPVFRGGRWTATGLLEAERKFRKVRGYQEMATVQHKLNPSLTQQVQVASREVPEAATL